MIFNQSITYPDFELAHTSADNDLRKAFDLVDHELLLKKLSKYRGSEQSLIWFRSYLTDRQQVVKYKQSVSEPQHVKVKSSHRQNSNVV